MKNKHNLIYLQELNARDVKASYVRWLNDYSVVKFTEQKFWNFWVEDRVRNSRHIVA